MNRLKGKYVNVVLSIEGARSLEFFRPPIHVTGNYFGRVLESDELLWNDGISTELVWEVEKKELRRARSSNHPLRVECLTKYSEDRRDRIGFVLLSLRSAQVVSLKDNKRPINFKWHKLIGCQAEHKRHHAELYMSLTITDLHLNEEQQDELIDITYAFGDEKREDEADAPEEDLEFCSPFTLKYLDDGYIQIGDDCGEKTTFSFNLFLREANNFETLLSETLVFRAPTAASFHITFKLFGVIIKTKPFRKPIRGILPLDEKVVVRILSTEQMLREFFGTPDCHWVRIALFYGNEMLGHANIDLSSTVFDDTPPAENHFFYLPPPNNIIPFGTDEQLSPFIKLEKWIQNTGDLRPKCAKVQVRSNLEKAECDGDHGPSNQAVSLDKLTIKADQKSKSACAVPDSIPDIESAPIITKSVETVVRNVFLSPRPAKTYDVTMTYIKFILGVRLENILWKSTPKDNIVIFKFIHPRASNYITIFTQLSNEIGVESDLKNISVKINYVSTLDQACNLLNAWPPKLVLTDEKEKLLSEEYEFDTSKFFSDDQDIYRYTADLKTVRSLHPLAKLKITLTLDRCAIYEQHEFDDFQLSPPVIDELLSVKELADIEQWKKNQKETFERELDYLKRQENNRLEAQWTQKKRELEDKLQERMRKCEALQQDLICKANSLKTEKYLSRHRPKALFEEIFNENWDKYQDGDIKEVIEALSKTQRDNECLKTLVEEQRNKLEAMEKSALTKEQTATLLQELNTLERGFEETQKAKKYFKEQWQRACNEIHDLKTEEYKNIQLSLRKSREMLSQLSLEGSDFQLSIGSPDEFCNL